MSNCISKMRTNYTENFTLDIHTNFLEIKNFLKSKRGLQSFIIT